MNQIIEKMVEMFGDNIAGWDQIFGAKCGKEKGNNEGEGSQAKEPPGPSSDD